jgi:hypothetical protein
MNWARGLFRLWVVFSIVWVPVAICLVAIWDLSAIVWLRAKYIDDSSVLDSFRSSSLNSEKVRSQIPLVCGTEYMKIGLPQGTDTGPAACHEFFKELFKNSPAGIIWDPEKEESKLGAEKTKTYTFEEVSEEEEESKLGAEKPLKLIPLDIPGFLSDALKEKGDLNWVSSSEKGKVFLAFMESELTKLRDRSHFMFIGEVLATIVIFVLAPPIALLILGSLLIWALLGFSPRDSKSLASEPLK